MTDEKKTGETSETPYPGTLSWAATRLLEAIGDAAKAVAEMLWESISRVFRDARRLMRKLAKALDPKWRRRRRALARSRRNNLYLKSIGRRR
ncbi:MAG: hypothetical protein U0N71_08730 [Collinsella sp.]